MSNILCIITYVYRYMIYIFNIFNENNMLNWKYEVFLHL